MIGTWFTPAILQQEAHGYALAGEEILSQRTLDIAHQWAAPDYTGDARGGHGSFCREIYLQLQRAHCWAALGKPRRAVHIYEATVPSLSPVYRRDSGLLAAFTVGAAQKLSSGVLVEASMMSASDTAAL